MIFYINDILYYEFLKEFLNENFLIMFFKYTKFYVNIVRYLCKYYKNFM